MNSAHAKRLSKFLSLILRHRPEAIGLDLDAAGWAEIDDLLAKAPLAGVPLDRASLEAVVRDNAKQRFALSPDGRRIRASQGHSIAVELDYLPQVPPEQLYHGTHQAALAAILAEGLNKRKRHHVHLSVDRATAWEVGQRHGPPVVLRIAAGEMAHAGHLFYRSANGVWLTAAVPPKFIGVETL